MHHTIDELQNRLFFRLFQAANLLHKQGTMALSDYGVTSQQWSILGALSRGRASAGMTVNEMSEYLRVSRQNVSAILGRMETAGWVRRVPDPSDLRSRRIVLTADGEKTWTAIAPLIQSFYSASVKGMTRQEQTQCGELLGRLIQNMSAL